MAFFGRNWLFFVRVKKLAFLRTVRRYNLYYHFIPLSQYHPRKNSKYWQYIARTMDEMWLIDEP